MRAPKVYWRWFRVKELSKGWEPTDTGWVLTIAVMVLVQGLALPKKCYPDGCRSKLDEFFNLRPSEMGDTLAGLFSALAFIWIIVTVFMQSRELREQRKEFREQRLATQDMARAMAAQADIFEQEAIGRKQEAISQLVEQLICKFQEEITTAAIIWQGPKDGGGGRKQVVLWPYSAGKYQTVSQETFFRDLLRILKQKRPYVQTSLSTGVLIDRPKQDALWDASDTLDDLLAEFSKLSDDQQVKIARLKLFEVKDEIVNLCEAPIWASTK